MELCTGKELYHRLVDRKRYLEKDAAIATHQMLLAINYLHDHNVAHRDLKLENWLYQDPSNRAKLKLIDFGFSRIWKLNMFMKQTCGSAAYVAPEVLARKYTTQCDMWSIGVIVFMLLSGRPPFYGPETAMLNDIAEGRYRMKPSRWQGVSADAKNFVQSLLQVDPDRRLTASKALNHPWVARRSKQNKKVNPEVLKDMARFAQSTRFRRAVLTMLAYCLTSEEVLDLHEIFLSIDRSQTGTISIQEFAKVMKENMQISNREVEDIFKALDNNDDHEITYSEFISAMLQHKVQVNENLVTQAFKRFDVSKTGTITTQDLVFVLGSETFSGKPMEELFTEVGIDKKDGVTLQQFQDIVCSNPAPLDPVMIIIFHFKMFIISEYYFQFVFDNFHQFPNDYMILFYSVLFSKMHNDRLSRDHRWRC